MCSLTRAYPRRQSPALLERPTWSDAEGHPLVFEPQPSEDPVRWDLVFDHSTDAEGWTYGSVFRQAAVLVIPFHGRHADTQGPRPAVAAACKLEEQVWSCAGTWTMRGRAAAPRSAPATLCAGASGCARRAPSAARAAGPMVRSCFMHALQPGPHAPALLA
jgi:hypothetical protein